MEYVVGMFIDSDNMDIVWEVREYDRENPTHRLYKACDTHFFSNKVDAEKFCARKNVSFRLRNDARNESYKV